MKEADKTYVEIYKYEDVDATLSTRVTFRRLVFMEHVSICESHRMRAPVVMLI